MRIEALQLDQYRDVPSLRLDGFGKFTILAGPPPLPSIVLAALESVLKPSAPLFARSGRITARIAGLPASRGGPVRLRDFLAGERHLVKRLIVKDGESVWTGPECLRNIDAVPPRRHRALRKEYVQRAVIAQVNHLDFVVMDCAGADPDELRDITAGAANEGPSMQVLLFVSTEDPEPLLDLPGSPTIFWLPGYVSRASSSTGRSAGERREA